jgi:glutamyl-tRNA synthetase
MDYAKLTHLNGVYLRQADDARLVRLTAERLRERPGCVVDPTTEARLAALMPALKERAKTLAELTDSSVFLAQQPPLEMEPKAAAALAGPARELLPRAVAALAATDFSPPALEGALRALAEADGIKLGALAQPLRAAVTGRTTSPPLDATLAALGRAEVEARVAAVLR